MSVQLNVPGSPGPQKQGPVDVWELVPVSDITTQQGGVNLYKVDFGGMQSIQVDCTNCNADLLLQFFLQDSPVGQPFLYMMWANQRHILKFDSPIQYILISNATGTFVLPGFMAPLLPYRNPPNTTGFILLSAQDSSVAVDGISNPVHIGGTLNIAGTVTADQGGSWAVGQSGSWNVGPAANFPVVNPANSQLVVSRPYIEQGTLAYTAPQTAHNIGPITIPANVTGLALGNTTPNTITLTVQGATSGLIYYSAQLTTNTIGLAALPLGGFENVNLLVTDSSSGSRSIQYGFVYDTTTIVPQNWGNGALSVTFAQGSSLTAQPGETATSGTSQQNTPGLTDQVIGSTFARFTDLWAISVSMALDDTGVNYQQAIIALKGTTTNKIVPIISCAAATTAGSGTGPYVGVGNASMVFPFPIPIGSIFPSDANLEWIARHTTPLQSGAGFTINALTS